MIDSSFFDTETLKQIADNTKPLDLFNQNLGWWSFGTAIVGVFISSLAAVFSFLGYKYQKLSAQKLEEIAPGDISYDSVSFSLVHNIIDLKSIFKDVTSYDDYPVKLIIDSDKLPDDLIDLSKYEKNKKNYDSACNLILAWRTYNIYLSHLSEIITTNKNVENISGFADFLIQYTSTQVLAIKEFEGKIQKPVSDKIIAWWLLDLLFENLQDIVSYNSNIVINRLSTEIKPSQSLNTEYSFLPDKINFNDYINYSNHNHRLKDIGESTLINNRVNVKSILTRIEQGEFDYLSQILKSKKLLSKVDFNDFKTSYTTIIEPLLVGFRRLELKQMKSLITPHN